ncbi:hypothetical protein BT96DRAFT_1013161 [Gymnopus androsaceus JB14]|uniref:Uncharacterized protein n=1 Tax=Gymnopus androsaceus JB14 TaxID=1447944 RepID=A0A6A4IKH8_9AGAR|nr:hypothetical protein BT96DRAFT_1013161 [Gymnopus androsaceus JB14]
MLVSEKWNKADRRESVRLWSIGWIIQVSGINDFEEVSTVVALKPIHFCHYATIVKAAGIRSLTGSVEIVCPTPPRRPTPKPSEAGWPIARNARTFRCICVLGCYRIHHRRFSSDTVKTCIHADFKNKVSRDLIERVYNRRINSEDYRRPT